MSQPTNEFETLKEILRQLASQSEMKIRHCESADEFKFSYGLRTCLWRLSKDNELCVYFLPEPENEEQPGAGRFADLKYELENGKAFITVAGQSMKERSLAEIAQSSLAFVLEKELKDRHC